MTKREQLRKGVRGLINGCYGARNPDYPKLAAFQPEKFLNELFPYLDSQGVVTTKHGFYSDLMEPLIEENKE